MQFILYTADKKGNNPKNCLYPTKRIISNAEELKAAIIYDHVGAAFKGNYRKNANYILANVAIMDCDNTFSEDPADWITPEQIKELFKDYSYALAYSRNHMKEKEGEAARPRFHIYFPIDELEKSADYSALKVGIINDYTFFDIKTKDTAHFMYGSDNAANDFIIWNEGAKTIDEDIIPVYEDATATAGGSFSGAGANDVGTPILEGSRNDTMSRYAAKVLKKYGDTGEAIKAFKNRAKDCTPALPDNELKTIWNSAKKLYRDKIVNDPGYVFPDEYNDESIFPEDFSDTGQAEAFLNFRNTKERVLYNESLGFLMYDGKVWAPEAEIKLKGLYQQFTAVQLKVARTKRGQAITLCDKAQDEDNNLEASEAQEDIKRWKSIINFIIKYRNAVKVNNTLDALKPFCHADMTQFDNNPFILNTPGGTVDLKTGKLKEHNPKDYCTKITRFSPGDKNTEMWLDHVSRISCQDEELAEYIKLVHGMMLIGKVYQEKLVITYGSGGNGKSSMFNAVLKALGDYAGGMSADALMRTRKNVMPEYAELRGRRFALASELDDGQTLNAAAVKRLCSTDKIHAEPKFKKPFDFTPSHTIVLCTNHLPKVDSMDAGTWDRLVVIPFNARFRNTAEEVKNYSDVLAEKAGGAILQWMIDGAVKFIANDYKLTYPEAVQDAVSEYKKANDWLQIFIDDRVEPKKGGRLSSMDLYENYRAWARERGDYIRRSNDFKAAMQKAGYKYVRTSTGIKVKDIALSALNWETA